MRQNCKCAAMTIVLATVTTWTTVLGATFEPRAIAPEVGVEALTRGVAREHLDRDLFGNPYASVLFGSVDVFDVFPYVESRYFIAVTDPEWNRIIISDTKQRVLTSFDGKEWGMGPLRSPHGLAVDVDQNIYVCDTDNNRIVVLSLITEFDAVEIATVHVIPGFSRPYDIAHSDGGTPFDPTDDRLYVAETGSNEVVRLVRQNATFVAGSRIGGLGSGIGRFAGPMAIAVGREEGRNTADVYVADAHNRRIVRLEDVAGELRWKDEMPHDAGLVTSLDTDHWGQIYLTSPSSEAVLKFDRDMDLIASLTEGIDHPRSFHIPFVNITDHRVGTRTRAGEAHGLLVEEWNESTGLKLWSLGLEVRNLEAEVDRDVRAQFHLTDPAWVTARLVEVTSGDVVAVREKIFLPSGPQEIQFAVSDLQRPIESGTHLLEIEAKAGYEEGQVIMAQTIFSLDGPPAELQMNRPFFLGNSPNPFRPQTAVHFYLPSDNADVAELSVYDLTGRLVFESSARVSGRGVHSLPWNGIDDRGLEVSSGVYYYKVAVAGQKWAGKMVRVR